MRSPYAASKWAVIGFTKTTAMELGPYGINVNAICPGCVDGDRIERVINADAKESGYTTDQIRDVYLRQSSMRKFMSKEDIADMVLFLTSSSGSKISGQAIAIDGHTEGFINWLD
jgi:NAD(P)-dependent dehydrogenase (short-subunit alcohol dehydrogenase family)